MKVTEKLLVGRQVSIVLTGDVSSVKNGSKLVDINENIFTVNSVGVVRYIDGKTRRNELYVLISPVGVDVGQELTLMQ